MFPGDIVLPPAPQSPAARLQKGRRSLPPPPLLDQSAAAKRERKRVSAGSRTRRDTRFAPYVKALDGFACAFCTDDSPVVESLHIIDVKYGGWEEASNGLTGHPTCHDLYDQGFLGVQPDGTVVYNADVPAKAKWLKRLRRRIATDRKKADERPDPDKLEWKLEAFGVTWIRPRAATVSASGG